MTPDPKKIILVCVGILAIAGGGAWAVQKYYFGESSQIDVTPGPCSQPGCLPAEIAETTTLALSDVEGWKTYHNEEYGFVVMYPEEWISQAGYQSAQYWAYWFSEPFPNPFTSSQIGVEIETNTKNETLEEIISKMNKKKDEADLRQFYSPDQRIIFNDFDAIQISLIKPEIPPNWIQDTEWAPGLLKKTIFLKGNDIYTITAIGASVENTEILYNNFLSTFEFIQ